MAQYINSYLCFVQPVNPFKTIIMSSARTIIMIVAIAFEPQNCKFSFL